MVAEGAIIEDFKLPDENGKLVSLSDFPGKKKVVYFYPKDDTPGCTTEACGIRDVYDQFLAKGAVVLGISADSAHSHDQFKKKYNLPFHLLADERRTVIDKFGAWGQKQMAGKSYEGILRSTFVLDEKNKIVKAFPAVKPDGHAQEILAVL